MLENFLLAEPVRRIIQMREDAVLPLEDVVVFVPGFAVVRVAIDGVRTGKITDLCDAQLPIAYLLIEQSRYNALRDQVGLARENVVVH